MKQGFAIIERNFLRNYGEIDIVASKNGITHLIEVKTVSRENVNHETLNGYRAEDNLHFRKLQRLRRVVQVYLIRKGIKKSWQFDVITVLYDRSKGQFHIKILENLVI